MPRIKCDVDGCSSSGVRMYRLPRNEELLAIWLKYIMPHNPELGFTAKKALISRQVCRLHFEDKYITKDQKRVSWGVPTLFTKEEIESGIPTLPLPCMGKFVINEHSYCQIEPHTDHNYTKNPELEGFETEDDVIGNVLIGNNSNGLSSNSNSKDDAIGNPLIGINSNWLSSNSQVNVGEPGDVDVPADDLIFPLDDPPDMGAEYDTFTEPEAPRPRVVTHNRLNKYNEIQNFMDEFTKDIQDDIQHQTLDDVQTGKFADELKSYNFSSNVLVTNKYLESYDNLEQLMFPEKAYAAITFSLLKQQELFEESIGDFLSWAANVELDYESLKRKVWEIFESGEFIKVSLQILQIVCKYRLKNTQLRKEGIVNQVPDEETKEALSKLEHSSRCLFDEESLRSIQFKPPPRKSKAKLKHDRAVQVNIVPRKIDKTVQVRPKKVRKAGKYVQVNTNELEGIATATKVKKKDAGSQTTEKDKLLSASTFLHDDPPLREQPETVEESLLSHCQKIQYVVNIKRKPLRHDGVKRHKDADSRESNHPTQGFERADYSRTQDDLNDISRKTDKEEVTPKKKRSAPEPSMPVLWDDCQNLLSLSEPNVNETESVQVYSTLERTAPKSPKRLGRPNFGKKRRPKIPDTWKERHSPMKSTGSSPMKGTSDNYQIPGKSSTALHICDSPYLLGGCKHTFDPQAESVPPSAYRDRSIHTNSGGKRRPQDIPEHNEPSYESLRNSAQERLSVAHTQSSTMNTYPNSPVFFNFPPRWA